MGCSTPPVPAQSPAHQPTGACPAPPPFAQAAAAPTGPFDIPAAPLLVPDGPWKHIDGGVCAAKGFRAAGMAAGLRAVGPKADLALVWADEPAVAAGTFTKNLMCAAPVTFTRRALEMESKGLAQAVLINAGQANAATGEAGYRDCVECAAGLAIFCGVAPAQSLILSTGVIGRRIKKEELLTALPDLFKSLGATPRHALEAAVAVTTTDLVSKSAALEVRDGLGGAGAVPRGALRGAAPRPHQRTDPARVPPHTPTRNPPQIIRRST